MAKPEIKGSVYRIRKIGAPAVRDPRGERSKLAEKAPADLTRYLDDPRPVVRDRAQELLVEAGRARRRRAGTRARRIAVIRGAQPRPSGRSIASARRARKQGVRAALERCQLSGARRGGDCGRDGERSAGGGPPDADGEAGSARGPAAGSHRAWADRRYARRSGSARGRGAAPRTAFSNTPITYALIELKTPGPVLEALKNPDPRIRQSALIALDQMDGSPLTANNLRRC